MASDEIDILVRADIGDAQQKLDATGKSVENLGTKSKKAGEDAHGASKSIQEAFKSMQERVEKNWLAIVAAASTAYKTIKDTMESVELAATFEEQTESVKAQFGVMSGEILDTMGKASKGTIANTKLMTMASRAMALGVTTDVNTLGKMMEYADIKAKALGKSSEEVFTNMAEGIGKSNPRMLKELGFTKDAFTKIVDGQTEAMSKTEILAKVMADAVPFVAKYKDENMSLADQMEATKASIQNAKLELGQQLMPVVGSAIPLVQGFIKGFSLLPGALKATGVAVMALVPAMVALYVATGPVGIALAAVGAAAALVMGQFGELQIAIEKQRNAGMELGKAKYAMADSDEKIARGAEAYIKSAANQKKTVEQLTEEIKNNNLAMGQNKEKIDMYAGRYADAEKKLMSLNKEVFKNGKEIDEQSKKANGAQRAMANLTDQNDELAKAVRGATMLIERKTQSTAAGARADLEHQAAMKKAREEVEKFLESADETGIDKKVKQIDRMVQVEGLGKDQIIALNKLRAEEVEKINAGFYQDEAAQRGRDLDDVLKNYEVQMRLAWDDAEKKKKLTEEKDRRLTVIEDAYLAKQVAAWKTHYDKIANIVGGTIDGLKGLFNLALLDEQRAIEGFNAVINILDQQYSDLKKTRAAEDYETEKARLEAAVANYTAAGDTKAAKDAQIALNRLNQDRDYIVKKEALDKEKEKKEKDLKVKQWNADHTAAILKGTMDLASATIAGIAALPVPPFPFAIAAGVLGGISLANIIAQPMPAFAAGGTSAGGWAKVGEAGEEMVRLPAGAQVFPAAVSRQMMAGGGGSVTNSSTTNATKTFNFSVQANDPIEFINRIKRAAGAGVFQ